MAQLTPARTLQRWKDHAVLFKVHISFKEEIRFGPCRLVLKASATTRYSSLWQGGRDGTFIASESQLKRFGGGEAEPARVSRPGSHRHPDYPRPLPGGRTESHRPCVVLSIICKSPVLLASSSRRVPRMDSAERYGDTPTDI
ncbi:unnamed protein product [Cylicocyclus nassatus]|uniref:Uncharacterized protein n=1 Tax=Cylicocyclus nassatus TaxID=53992 RepID=A0AA36GV16_CYLNA|nr:unnamed protein product [Cylicocyclus nassatus]